MDGDDSMILDTGKTIYVWIGSSSNENEKRAAKETAQVNTYSRSSFVYSNPRSTVFQKYLKTDAMPRPSNAKIVTTEQGKEPSDFTKHFVKWDANFWKKVSIIAYSLVFTFSVKRFLFFIALNDRVVTRN